MIKQYCDGCGKDITQTDFSTLKINRIYYFREYILCLDCINKIMQIIDSLALNSIDIENGAN